MSPKKWIEGTDIIDIVLKEGRYGGTHVYNDIVMSFATGISPEFQLYIMKDYRIHTDVIKENLIPTDLTTTQIAYTYANKADMLNVVLFGKIANQYSQI